MKRHWATFIEEAICQKEAKLLSSGALAVETGASTESASHPRFVIRDEETEDVVNWRKFRAQDAVEGRDLLRDVESHMAQMRVFEVKAYIGSQPIEFLTTSAWHAAFASLIFRSKPVRSVVARSQSLGIYAPLRIWHDPDLKASQCGVSVRGEAFTLLDPSRTTAVIVGTRSLCEIKDAAFLLVSSIFNQIDLVPLRAAACAQEDGSHACLILAPMGVNKTSLAFGPDRWLIGEDEVLWTANGLSNLEGGCYTSLARLSAVGERELFESANSFGSLLENVKYDDETRDIDVSDQESVDGTRTPARAAFPLSSLRRVYQQQWESPQPESLIFVTPEKRTAVPVVTKLTLEETREHYREICESYRTLAAAPVDSFMARFTASRAQAFALGIPSSIQNLKIPLSAIPQETNFGA